MAKKAFIKRRMAARLAAIQSLYAASVCNDTMPTQLAAYTNEEGHQVPTDTALRDVIVSHANAEKNHYDSIINANLNKKNIDSLELLLRLILRCACAELLNCQETKISIIISAYVDIAREFYDTTETAFVNAILDKIAKSMQ